MKMEKVSTKYGAPMGRADDPSLSDAPRSVRLFHVPLDYGGYDNGGAYWGHGGRLWCAMDRDGCQQFARAASREGARIALDIPRAALIVPTFARPIPAHFPVRPLAPGDTAADHVTCNTCGRSWDDAIVTSYTPAPGARCPFEAFHS